MSEEARAAAGKAARDSYGRLLAYLAARTRNIAAAEDALGEAFAAACADWPVNGTPAAPDAWLLTAARRKLIDSARRRETAARAEPDIVRALEEAAAENGAEPMTDDRLKLMFACAHPAIDPAMRTPLILQTIMGLDAARIAGAFLIAPATMGQRLVRAKRKIAAARIPFDIPQPEHWSPRVADVLEAIYAAYTAGGGALAGEALYLARLVAGLAPDEPEALGLAALIAFIEARTGATPPGGFAPLDDQDPGLWDAAMIAEADQCLARAAGMFAPGRYQIEAAIQQAHIARRRDGADARAAIIALYDRLLSIAPSTGARIARAAALIAAEKPARALADLRALDAAILDSHQPYWATLAHALAACGEAASARAAFDQAIALAPDAGVAAFLAGRRDALCGG